jgi:WD40 repeat protein
VVRFSPDGKLLATGSWEGEIKLWDPATGALVKTLSGAPRTMSMRFSPDSRFLVACSDERGVLLYDLATGVSRSMASGHTARISDAEISPNGRLLATCSEDESVRVWDIESGIQKLDLRGHSYTVSHVAWSPDGKILASGGHDGARFWNIEAADTVEQPLPGSVRRNFFSPDGKWMVVTSPESGVALHEFPSLKKISEPSAMGFPLRFSSDGSKLVTLQQRDHAPAQISRWAVPEMRLLSTVELPESSDPLSLAELAPQGRWLIAGLEPDQIAFWDIEANVLSARLPINIHGVGRLRAIAISPSGRYLATSYHDWPVIHVTDFSTEKRVRVTTARHRGQVTRLVFSADERTLVSSDSDKYIKIWDVETKLERATLLGHRLQIIDVDISPDGRTIVSSSEDGSVRLWNVATRREVARYEKLGIVDQVTFAPDGNALLLTSRASSDQPATTLVWRAPTLAEIDGKIAAEPAL